jgi:hypothetical protein
MNFNRSFQKKDETEISPLIYLQTANLKLRIDNLYCPCPAE